MPNTPPKIIKYYEECSEDPYDDDRFHVHEDMSEDISEDMSEIKEVLPNSKSWKSRAEVFIVNYVFDNLKPSECLSVEYTTLSKSRYGRVVSRADFQKWYKKIPNLNFDSNLFGARQDLVVNIMIAAKFGDEYPNITKIFPPFYNEYFIVCVHCPEAKQFVIDNFSGVLNTLRPSALNNENLENFLGIICTHKDCEKFLNTLVSKSLYFKKPDNVSRFYNEALIRLPKEMIDRVYESNAIHLEDKPLFAVSTKKYDVIEYSVSSLMSFRLLSDAKPSKENYTTLIGHIIQVIAKSDALIQLGVNKIRHIAADQKILININDDYNAENFLNLFQSAYDLASSLNNSYYQKDSNMWGEFMSGSESLIERAVLRKAPATQTKKSVLKL